jgi:hypothetical protein
MKPLDFAVIGAQKCATTTLFELLRQHPGVHLPLEKEVPFFTGDDCGPGAWTAFSHRIFGAEDGRLRGKVTPQYMANPEVPARMASLMPKLRLIALLRDPLERSRSHFRMGVRRQTETRSFDEAMRACLDRGELAHARAGRAPTHSRGYESEAAFYLAWSEYGRILNAYRRYFPPQQMLVLYTHDLEDRPAETLRRVIEFLGLPTEGFEPRGLGEVMHAGGGGSRIPHGVRVWLRERGPVAWLWSRVPPQQQGRLRFLYERWNTRKQREPLPLSRDTEQALTALFAEDLAYFAAMDMAPPPWRNAYLPASPALHRRGDSASPQA